MKMTVRGLMGFLLFLGVAAFIAGCGSSSTASGGGGNDGSGGGGTEDGATAVTNNTNALAGIPDMDPTSIDYSVVDASTNISAGASKSKAVGTKERGAGDSSEILLRIAQEYAADGTRTFQISQCVGATQMGFAEVAYANDTYTMSVSYREDPMMFDIIAVMSDLAMTDANFASTVDLYSGDGSRLYITADGENSSNTMQGNYVNGEAQIAAFWNDAAGCGKGEGQGGGTSVVCFDISVNASTKVKTYEESDDDALASFVPDYLTSVGSVSPTFSAEQAWECDLPSGSSWIEIGSAYDLEDAGGTECVMINDFWGDASYDPSSCLDPEATETETVTCVLDKEYAYAVQSLRMAQRMFVCKAKGLFNLVKEGTITDVQLGDNETIYVKIASVFGD